LDNISKFCEGHRIDPKLEEAFTAYIRSDYAGKYSLRNGETTKLVVSKLTMEEVGEAWNDFVNHMKQFLTEQHVP
jgi:hypothetical protein